MLKLTMSPARAPEINARSAAARRVLQRAIRAVLKSAKSNTAEKIKSRYISAGLGTRPLKVNVRGLSGTLSTEGRRNPLEKFKINPRVRLKRPSAMGIFAQVVKNQGGNIKRAFIAKGSVFERVGVARLPIKKLTTVSAIQMAKSPPVSDFVLSKVKTDLNKYVDRELARLL